MRRKLHVLVTKPAVQTLEDHKDLIKVAKEEGVLCYVEHHKRFDPVYLDARNKFRTSLGDLSFFTSYMSQPKTQLDTFKVRLFSASLMDPSLTLQFNRLGLARTVTFRTTSTHITSMCSTISLQAGQFPRE